MFLCTKTIPFLLISATLLLGGCSTVNQSLLLDGIPEARSAGKLRASSVSVTAPKAGDVVFTYADVMPSYYISGARVSGGAKRADVIYTLEKGTEKITASALNQIFSIDSTSPYTVTGRLDFEFTEVPKSSERAGSQDVDVSILLTLNLRVDKGSEGVFSKAYQAQRKDTNKAFLLTFPTNYFLNTLFSRALGEALSSASADNDLAQAFER